MKFSFIVFLLAFVHNLFGQITYTKDIAHIVYNKCSSCHRPGEIGPFSLTNYNEVSSFAATIKYVTSIKYMPPWKANPDYQHFLDENYLTDEEITKIGAWVDAGSPYGSAVEEPTFPDFPVATGLDVIGGILGMMVFFTYAFTGHWPKTTVSAGGGCGGCGGFGG